MYSVPTAVFLTGQGLDGNVAESKRRQVTIIEREAWDGFMQDLGASTDPSARRANVMISGISLENTRGKTLAIGEIRLLIGGETTPCELMEAALPGLQNAMRPKWGGGAFAQVIVGGRMQVGDAVVWEDV
jgi:MOSC domain-containing protein YiiM